MFGINLVLSTGHKFKKSKDFYSRERHKTIDKYRDECTRNPCCRKDNSGLEASDYPLPPFFIWADGKYINHLTLFLEESEAKRFVRQWIKTERQKFCGEKWNFPDIHIKNVFGPDVDSFIHPIEDTGIFLHWISNGQITKENFWNGSSMETYQNHDFFKTESVNSIDDMSHWERYSEDIKNFSRDYRKTKLDWGIKLCTSLTP